MSNFSCTCAFHAGGGAQSAECSSYRWLALGTAPTPAHTPLGAAEAFSDKLRTALAANGVAARVDATHGLGRVSVLVLVGVEAPHLSYVEHVLRVCLADNLPVGVRATYVVSDKTFLLRGDVYGDCDKLAATAEHVPEHKNFPCLTPTDFARVAVQSDAAAEAAFRETCDVERPEPLGDFRIDEPPYNVRETLGQAEVLTRLDNTARAEARRRVQAGRREWPLCRWGGVVSLDWRAERSDYTGRRTGLNRCRWVCSCGRPSP